MSRSKNSRSKKLNTWGFISITFWMLLTFFPVQSQISPGELSNAHADLEGISNCKKCHELGKKVSSARCSDCHTEIRLMVENNKGYHGSEKISAQECFDCHNEHHGRNFKITVFDTLSFDHWETSYELKGKHQNLACKKCHTPSNVPKRITKKTKSTSYLGLQTDCLSCHEDHHQKTLGTDCMKCHSLEGFKPASGFHHEQTKFALLGKHATVACIECHKIEEQNGRELQKFKGISFRKCTDCHEDKHKGKFGTDCLKCHDHNSFIRVKNLNSFNHDQTNYPLEGEHLKLDCKKCHKESLTKKLKYGSCTDCHEDYHKGDFLRNGKAQNCIECHTLNGFKPSTYTLENHNQGDFKLVGSHLATPCFECHKKTTEWSFRNLGKKCIDCHQDNHNGGITEKFMPRQNCASCHNPDAWPQISFDHKLTDFPLTGKHIQQTCRDCHYKKGPQEEPIQRFKTLSPECLECHEDAHNKQFSNRPGITCTRCHETNDWKPVRFDHDDTRFPLDGKHKDVECIKCHKAMPGTKPYFQYVIKNISCAGCHS